MLQEEEEEERALDLQMEIDRLKALEAYEERERQRTAESRIGAQILNEQIVERKRERVHQEELRDLVRMLAKLIASNFPLFMVIKTKDCKGQRRPVDQNASVLLHQHKQDLHSGSCWYDACLSSSHGHVSDLQ